jgi:putative flippase GtrA
MSFPLAETFEDGVTKNDSMEQRYGVISKVNIMKKNGFIRNTMSKHQTKVRFVLVGAWNTVFGFGTFLAFYSILASVVASRSAVYMSALTLSNIIAITNAYIFHKYLTFRSPITGFAAITEFFRFASSYAFTFAISLALMPFLVEVIGFNARIAGGLVLLICLVVGYVCHSRFSFGKTRYDG